MLPLLALLFFKSAWKQLIYLICSFFYMTDFELPILTGQLSHILETSLKFNKLPPKQ